MNERERGYAGWRAAWACAAGSFFASFPYYSYAVFLRPVAEEFHWTRQAAAGGYATMAFVAALAAPFVGRLIDRIGPRRVIIPALGIIGLGVMSLSMLTPSLLHLYAVCTVIGFASIGASAVAYSRVIFGWFDALRGRALGMMLAGGMVSTIILPPLVVAMIRAFGWRTSYFALGAVVTVVGLPIVIKFLRERPRVDAGTAAAAAGATVREALATRRFWTLILVIFGAAPLVSGSLVHTSALLTDRGLTADRAAIVMSVMGAANLCGRLLTGWMLDRFAAQRVAAALLATGAAGGLLMASASTFGTAVIAAALIGGGSGGEIDVNPYLLSKYFGLRSLATLYGFNWMALGLASAIGPVLMGRAFDATGSYTTALGALSAVTLVVAAVALTLPAPRRHTDG